MGSAPFQLPTSRQPAAFAMKTVAPALALAALLSMTTADSADAQSIGSFSDWANDYELYIADWETNWYTIVTWKDGSTTEYWSYSEKGAKEWSTWLHLHLSDVADTDIVSRLEPGEWEYYDTFDTYAQANAAASEMQYFGFATDIRSILVNEIHKTPNKLNPDLELRTTPTLSTK